jgi:hypothetical protein
MTNEFILGLDILRAYAASVDIERQTLRLAEEYILWWSPEAGPRPSNMIVEENKVMPALCKGTVMGRLERPLGVGNGLIEPSPKAHQREGMYIARSLFKDWKKVPVRVLNNTHHDQKLTRGSAQAQYEPITLVTTHDLEQLQARNLSSKLQDTSEAAMTNLSYGEF